MREYSIVRKIIVFAIFFVALGVVAPTLVLYSLGYRLDKKNNSFIQSGSVVVKSTPASPKISINGQEVAQKSIDLINRSLNINGLNPSEYQLEISSDGFYPWKKNVEVTAGIATEFWNIILVPQQVEPKTIISDNLTKYAFSPDKKKLAYFVNKDNYLSLFVKDQSQTEDSFVYKVAINQRFSPEPGELKWSSDGQWLLFSFKKNNTEEVYLTSTETNYTEVMPIGEAWLKSLTPKNEQQSQIGKKNNPVPELKILNYTWDSKENIFFDLSGALYGQAASNVLNWYRNESGINENANTSNNNINAQQPKKDQTKKIEFSNFSGDTAPAKVKENVDGFTFCGGNICSINVPDKKLEVYSQNGDLQKAVNFPDNYQMTEQYELFAYSSTQTAILDSNNNLFLWDEAQNKLDNKEGMKFIFPGVKEVYFSDDGKKLLFSTSNEAYVYFVKDWDVQPKHSSGDLEVIYRDPSELKKVQWYLDYQNIFIENKDGIKLIELDGRGGRNSEDFVKNSNITDMGYDAPNKKLWYTEKGENDVNNLEEITFPVTQSLFSGIMNSSNN